MARILDKLTCLIYVAKLATYRKIYRLCSAALKTILQWVRYADDASILHAAEIAGVTQFVNRHPEGFDMPVGERGASLSGGQRQSVAVARSMLLSPPIYIMDEPSNSMDNSTEARFKEKLSEQLAHQTLILVTHRASLLTLVDRLIVMDGAKIVADGPKENVLEALKKDRSRFQTNYVK